MQRRFLLADEESWAPASKYIAADAATVLPPPPEPPGSTSPLLVLLPLLVVVAAAGLVLGLVLALAPAGPGAPASTTTSTSAAASTSASASTSALASTTSVSALLSSITTSAAATTTTGTTTTGGPITPAGLRIVNGVVGFTLPVLASPDLLPCLLAPPGYCRSGITVLPYIVSGQGFTVSNAGVRILLNLPLCTDSCPSQYLSTESFYDIHFTTPFTTIPSVQTAITVAPLSVLSSCTLGLTLGFTGTGALLLPQFECDLTTRFKLTALSSLASAQDVTTAGMRSTLFVQWQMCPLGNNTISQDDFCHAALLFVLQFYDPVLQFTASVVAIGQ